MPSGNSGLAGGTFLNPTDQELKDPLFDDFGYRRIKTGPGFSF